MNKALVMQLARCEYVERRENASLGNSGTGKTHVALGLGAASAGDQWSSPCTSMEARDERRLLCRAGAPQPIDDPSCPVPHRRRIALRGLQPALRARLHRGNRQPPIRRVDRGFRLGVPYRSAAGPPHPPRAHPPIPRDVHFGGLEELKDSTALHLTYTSQLGATDGAV